jgi:serine/threonine protein kinase
VKQFFEEINENFYHDFSLFNAIKGHHCTAVTHVLGNVGLPVGLIFEHLPFLLDEEMLSFSLADAVRVLVQCAAALHSLHVSDIVHSNINTFSFVISKDYSRVKFIEFAIDQSILSSIGFVHRQEPLFTAPELSNESNSPTVLADIYAFGMLIWRLLHPTSLLPFSNAPIAVSLAAARGSLPVFTRAGIPACILDICHRCLARDPNVRPQSMVDVINALKTAQIL